MKKSASILLPLCLLLTSCSVYMAANKPSKKDLNVLDIGTPRDVILGEFGPPNKTIHNEEGELVESWSFKQGDSTGVKVVKTAFHAAADVFTLGLWEVVGTPAEIILEQDLRTYIVTFDKDENVKGVKVLGKGGLQKNK